ncbi:TadA family conjugal transfer-associated ATPase [Pseudoclavibacter sp. 13-3]|uniref:TadA family conjugal transfer-associated ATPase n=1 Tax=Pseudoclavibacter sp. 13-3 TaxID=2901228 RepID=UPI002F90ABE4
MHRSLSSVADAGRPLQDGRMPHRHRPSLDAETLGAFGPLRTLIARAGVTDVLVTAPDEIWIDRGEGVERVPLRLSGQRQLRALAVSLISAGGRHLDDATPFVDVRLGELRVHAVLPPVAVGGVQLSVRVPQRGLRDFDSLLDTGMIVAGHERLLRDAICSGANLLITGATATGKTTLLRALLQLVEHDQRIICVEDVAELDVRHPHVVQLEARQPNADGLGAVGLDVLLRQALRMRPDRIVVGECRGPELMLLMTALNTGHRGGAGTLHANSVADVPARLEAMALMSGISERALARQAASAFDLVLHLGRSAGARRLEQVGRLEVDADGLLVARVLTADPERPSAQGQPDRPTAPCTRRADD